MLRHSHDSGVIERMSANRIQAKGIDMTGLNRRDVMSALLAISATGALSACKKGEASEPVKSGESAEFAASGQFLSKSEMARLSVLCDIIIPTTDTPGAVAAGVPQTLQGLLSEWATDEMRVDWRVGLKSIYSKLTQLSGAVFTQLSTEDKFSAVKALDDLAFSDQASEADAKTLAQYKDMKSTIATAYYMSEIGASVELRYEAVPGEWRGCVPLAEIGRTWAT